MRIGVRLLLVLAVLAAGPAHGAEPATDLRVLIDISGSMKQNDPHKLRAPAVRLLVGLLPKGTRAGLWTFGRYANMTVKLGRVTESWKRRARRQSRKIHSRGQHTHIEEALRRATAGWHKPGTRYKRHLILLSDGMIDIGKSAADNAASRKRILKDLLPQLKAAGVKLHTIALSNQADHKLLKELAVSTDGWYEKVDDAKQLQRVFLRLFEKSVPADTLPLRDNRFQVDKNVSDMTLLVFRAAGVPATRILAPGKQIYTRQRRPATVKWHHETGYDLITIKRPQAGKWRIDGAVDPLNRVMVITNLRLKVDELPNNIVSSDTVPVNARLSRDGKPIRHGAFLQLVRFAMSRQTADLPAAESALTDDGLSGDSQAADGVYGTALPQPLPAGDYELVISAQGPTFQREYRHRLKVYGSPVRVRVEKPKNRKDDFNLALSLQAGLMQEDTVRVALHIDGQAPRVLQRGADQAWRGTVARDHAGAVVRLQVRGVRSNGRDHTVSVERILPELTPPPAPKPVVKLPPIQLNPVPSQPVPQPAPVAGNANWLWVGATVGGVNVLALAGLGGLWVAWRKRRRRELAFEKEVFDHE